MGISKKDDCWGGRRQRKKNVERCEKLLLSTSIEDDSG